MKIKIGSIEIEITSPYGTLIVVVLIFVLFVLVLLGPNVFLPLLALVGL